ncbi:hypothetical protein HFA01_25900 [Halobacillus faecis]|uniref:YhfH family protein n=4 Tax=Halobacillus TaxID=45667 RepID=A0A511WVM0_9BACI|nr:hypothetical protein HFA01_25900 [Halobacillus faecis]
MPKFKKLSENGCNFVVLTVNCTITDKQNKFCYNKGGAKMKKQQNVPCPQCGSKIEGHTYNYMMECDRCLSKKDE